jgi:Thioredoxin
MAPDWEKLAEEFKDHAAGLVAEIDCTAGGKALCDANGIQGFPTLKYGDPSILEDYEGQRTYDALAAFAKDNWKPVCSPANLDLCEAEKKKQIEEYMKLSAEDLASKIEAEERKQADAEEHFNKEVKKLLATLAEFKDSGLGLLKAVKSFKDKDEL